MKTNLLKSSFLKITGCGFATIALLTLISAATPEKETTRIGIVSFKRAVENSRMGKHEQETLEGVKSQMESVLIEKDKVLTGIAKQLNDPDHLDSISPDEEKALQQKFQSLSQEFAQLQNQYMQAFQQATGKITQKLASAVGKAAQTLALQKNYAYVLNDDNLFYYAQASDVTDEVIKVLDQTWETDRKKLLQEISEKETPK